MPLTRTQADAMIKAVRIPFLGEDGTEIGDLNITFRPNLLSRDEFRRMKELSEGSETDDDDNGLAPLLSRVIVGWDFLQDDGTPYPVNVDSLGMLGYGVQQAIVSDMVSAPNAQSGRRSGRSSAETRMLPAIESSRREDSFA